MPGVETTYRFGPFKPSGNHFDFFWRWGDHHWITLNSSCLGAFSLALPMNRLNRFLRFTEIYLLLLPLKIFEYPNLPTVSAPRKPFADESDILTWLEEAVEMYRVSSLSRLGRGVLASLRRTGVHHQMKQLGRMTLIARGKTML